MSTTKCSPSDNHLGIIGTPGIPLPGFDIPFSPITIPAPGFELPEGFPEKILDFINSLKIPWLGGDLAPFLDDFGNDILKALASVFNQIAPFVSFYNFLMALLNMGLCIIDIFCAMPNPWSVSRAIVRLVKQCLPPFLNLFPWIALLAMIIAFLLLLLALIEYIIQRILQLIEDLLRNLDILAEGLSFQDGESTAAAAVKIASLLCLFDNLVAILTALGAIIAIFQTLAAIAGRRVCAAGGNGDEDVCPPFIADNPVGIQGEKGKLIYHNKIHDIGSSFGAATFDRDESWQFLNDDPNQASTSEFSQILAKQTVPSTFFNSGFEEGDIYWPSGKTFDKETTLRAAPYLVDLVLEGFNPAPFVPSDTNGSRDFVIKDVIVHAKPYIGVYNYQNNKTNILFDDSQNNNTTGTLKLVGGQVFELNQDGTEIPYMVNGEQASLETFISKPKGSSVPIVEDGYTFTNITFNFKINHAALTSYNLISYGCIPAIQQEVEIANLANGDISAAIAKINPIIPDVGGCVTCMQTAVAKLRTNVTRETTETFRAEVLACMEGLRSETEGILCKVLLAAVDPYHSQFGISPDMQFITKQIIVNIELFDKGGINISKNIPNTCASQIIDKLKINATFGTVTDIVYNSTTGIFTAFIESAEAGEGEVSVLFDGNTFSTILNRNSVSDATTVENIILPYSFVGYGEQAEKPRRDATDVARSGE